MSCLFDSLSCFFIKDNVKVDSKTVRNIICDYLDNNNKLIDGIETDFILSLDIPKDQYINRMRQYAWGGGIEIQAACNIWNVRILVYIISDKKFIEFIPLNGTYNHTIEISWTGNHYEPIKAYKK